jgi:Secretion system C-terminal sorting domain
MIICIRLLCLLLIFFSFYKSASAQQSFTSVGGDAKGPTGSVSYSVGLLTYKTHISRTGMECQGMQHPLEISRILSSDDQNTPELSILAFPNPTTDILSISGKDNFPSGTIAEFRDMKGSIVKSLTLENKDHSISISELITGTYLLIIKNDDTILASFKIIKNEGQ